MKKLLATILALVMAIGLTTAAWADGEGTTANVAKIGECCDKFQHSDHEGCGY